MRQSISVQRRPPANLRQEDLPLFESALQAQFERNSPVMIKNALILQDTVLAPGEFKFYSDFTHRSNLGLPQFSKRIGNCVLKAWRKIPKGIWIIDEWSPNYFHWLTDCLPRLWEGLKWDATAPIVLPDSYSKLAFVRESIQSLGTDVIFYRSSENLWVDQMILTARTASFPNFNEPLTLFTQKRLRKEPQKPPFRKVYFTRKSASKRKVINELDLELMLIKRNFEIISADELSFESQMQLMSETEVLIGLHGAALTNMIFLPSGSKVIEFRNAKDPNSHCYFNLASALQIPYYYTLNEADQEDSVIADFTIDIPQLQSVLDQIS